MSDEDEALLAIFPPGDVLFLDQDLGGLLSEEATQVTIRDNSDDTLVYGKAIFFIP